MRALFLLLAGFGALLLSLLPFALSFARMLEPNIWRVCSGLMVAYTLSWWALWRLIGSRLDWTPIAHNIVMVRFTSIGLAINVPLQTTNLWLGQLAPFFAGLLWLLLYGCVQFAVISYLRPRS